MSLLETNINFTLNMWIMYLIISINLLIKGNYFEYVHSFLLNNFH